jgi:hypothetical protein
MDLSKIRKTTLAKALGVSYTTIMKWQKLGILEEKVKQFEEEAKALQTLQPIKELRETRREEREEIKRLGKRIAPPKRQNKNIKGGRYAK